MFQEMHSWWLVYREEMLYGYTYNHNTSPSSLGIPELVNLVAIRKHAGFVISIFVLSISTQL